MNWLRITTVKPGPTPGKSVEIPFQWRTMSFMSSFQIGREANNCYKQNIMWGDNLRGGNCEAEYEFGHAACTMHWKHLLNMKICESYEPNKNNYSTHSEFNLHKHYEISQLVNLELNVWLDI